MFFDKGFSVSTVTPVGIAIYCSDPRPNLWKYIKQDLIPQNEIWVPIGVLGGGVCLANQEALPQEFNFLLAQIYFAMGTFPKAKKIIVVSHDCGYYARITQAKVSIEKKKKDVAKAVVFLKKQIPGMEIVGFFAEKQGQDGFIKID